jgi:hypothetical protein
MLSCLAAISCLPELARLLGKSIRRPCEALPDRLTLSSAPDARLALTQGPAGSIKPSFF